MIKLLLIFLAITTISSCQSNHQLNTTTTEAPILSTEVNNKKNQTNNYGESSTISNDFELNKDNKTEADLSKPSNATYQVRIVRSNGMELDPSVLGPMENNSSFTNLFDYIMNFNNIQEENAITNQNIDYLKESQSRSWSPSDNNANYQNFDQTNVNPRNIQNHDDIVTAPPYLNNQQNQEFTVQSHYHSNSNDQNNGFLNNQYANSQQQQIWSPYYANNNNQNNNDINNVNDQKPNIWMDYQANSQNDVKQNLEDWNYYNNYNNPSGTYTNSHSYVNIKHNNYNDWQDPQKKNFEDQSFQNTNQNQVWSSNTNFKGYNNNAQEISKPQAQVFKHVYVHAAPEEPETPKPRKPITVAPPQKHYKLIFIKAPTPPAPTAPIMPAQQQIEEKTLVYVLSKKQEEPAEIKMPTPAPQPISKPEVYFIRYKTKTAKTEEGYPKAQGNSLGQNVDTLSITTASSVENTNNNGVY